MGDSDDGMVLNLTPYIPKPKEKKNKQDQHQQNKSLQDQHDNDGRNNPIKKKSTSKHFSKDRKYVDPKDFTPISTLFNKNPEAVTLPELTVTGKCQEVVFTSDNVDELPINPRLRSNLKDQFKFTKLTKVQKLSIPKLLQNKDVLIKAPTGSGKTMCYAVPIIDKLSKFNPSVSRSDGAYAIVIVPTRELAFQTFNIIQDLCKSCISIVPGILIGGEKCKSEKARLRKGVNIVIATPGRLNYHLQETSCLDVSKVSFLVLDEADKLLDMGFEKSIKDIIKELDNRGGIARQSVLLSATLTSDIQNLASIALNESIFIDSEVEEGSNKNNALGNHSDLVVPGSLTQFFVSVPAKLRLVTLISFVVKNALECKNKVMVFNSSINSVIFIYDILKLVLDEYFNMATSTVLKNIHILHGDMTQADRLKAFEQFKVSTFGILFCTDVAARGLDIKGVDWIVQYSCPNQIEDYLHRVGRTARIGEKGKSLLFLMPSEMEYAKLLSDASVVLKEMELFKILSFLMKKNAMRVTEHKIEERATELQGCIEEAILKSKDLQQKAIQSYKSYIQSYATYPSSQKHIFHVKHLHLGHVAKSVGLREAPTKIANITTNVATKRKQQFEEEKIKRERSKKQKLKRDLELADGVFSGPRPGKQKVGSFNKGQKTKNVRRKRKIRI